MSKQFKLTCIDAQTFCAIPIEVNISPQMILLFRGFPEQKWNKARKGWNIPATEPNIIYLRNTWLENEYEVSENAKIILAYTSVVHKVEEKRAERRWEYLFNDVQSTFDPPYTRKPFQHQLVATESCIGAEAFGLLMEMGTGKTYCVGLEMNYYACKMEKGEMIRVLIACPKSLRENWLRELKMAIADIHNIAIEVLNGDMKSIEQIMNLLEDEAMIKIAIVSYDSVPSMLRQLQAFKPTYLCCDESHYLKNPESERSKAMNTLSDSCAMKRILTGTPVSNNILDVWHQFEILRKGALGYTTYTAFKREYAIVESSGQFETVVGFNKDHITALKENMARISFVVKKERCLDLPQKMFETCTVTMPENIRTIYDSMAKDFYVSLEGDKECQVEYIIVQMMKLCQICSGFLVSKELVRDANGDYDQDNPEFASKLSMLPNGDYKMNRMLDDAEEVIESGSKLIIWSRFKHDSKLIFNALKARGIKAVTFDGSTNAEEKQKALDSFNTDDSTMVFIGNTKSGGVGLTLLGTKNRTCHTTFFYSNDFSFGMRSQAEDRNHRIGQVNKVLYRDYVAENSIEEYIASVLVEKRDVADEVKNIHKIKNILLKQAQ